MDDPALPVKLLPASNGEYVPQPATPLVREAVRRAVEACDDNARRIGMSRRDFLRSTCGAATTLLVLAACSQEARGGKEAGGVYRLPKESTTEPAAAEEAIGGDGFVMDVQGHLLEYDLDQPAPPDWLGRGFPQAACGDDDPRACFSTGHFLQEVLAGSDTTIVVLSAVPVADPDGPLRTEVMEAARRAADRLCGEGRVLLQGHVAPTAGVSEIAIEQMEASLDRYPIAAWKTYTHAAGPGWFLDDHDPRAPQVGQRFIEQALALGRPVICVHKGLSGGSAYASPVDLGPAAAQNPAVRLVAYHSGYEGALPEGPYTDATRDIGVNRVISSARDAGLVPGANVYAELGSTWRSLMGRPDEAAHVIGKLLLHLGEDNVLWGTDSIWYGSPQDQIQAFRAFEISPAYQEQYGYPALTPSVKAKVLGLNAARLYGIDAATAPRCELSAADRAELRLALPGTNHTFGPS